MCLVGVLTVHTGNKPLAAHSIPTVYQLHTHSTPTAHPQYTQSILIPHICHEPHEYIRVNFFWPV